MNIERILCPVDFSDLSRLALHHAASVASWYGAHVDLLHVIVEPLPSWSPPAWGPRARAPGHRKAYGRRIAAALHAWPPN